jgi:hypothetical protein
MKANFKIKEGDRGNVANENEDKKSTEMTDEEFEDYIVKSGAAGSFMVFRNFKKKQDELGIDEI